MGRGVCVVRVLDYPLISVRTPPIPLSLHLNLPSLSSLTSTPSQACKVLFDKEGEDAEQWHVYPWFVEAGVDDDRYKSSDCIGDTLYNDDYKNFTDDIVKWADDGQMLLDLIKSMTTVDWAAVSRDCISLI